LIFDVLYEERRNWALFLDLSNEKAVKTIENVARATLECESLTYNSFRHRNNIKK